MDMDRITSRRRMLGAALGGAAAIGVATLSTPALAQAADDDPLLLGAENTASSITVITRTPVANAEAATLLAETTISAALVGHATEGRGVLGISTSGQGVRGEATTGTGGAFASSTGYALSTAGRIRFTKVSGIATIWAGATSKTEHPGVDVVTASFVLLTPRSNLGSRGLWYTIDTAANTITIRISSALGSNVSIGWLLLG
jgi:hypothetical protein